MKTDNGILREKAQKAISYIRGAGADEGQVHISESEKREFNVENGEFSLMRTLFDENINVLVYKEHKKGSYGGNKTTDADIENAVKTAVMAAECAEADEAYAIAPGQGEVSADKGTYEPDTDLLFRRTTELIEDIRKNYPKTVIVALIIEHNRKHSIYMNTNETVCEEYAGSYCVTLEISGHEGDRTTSMMFSRFETEKLDTPFIEKPQVKRILETAEKQLCAEPMEGKFTGTMLLTPECLANFLLFITGMAGGNAILEKTSIWLDKLGERIADPRITVSFDPTDKRVVCGKTITADGFLVQPYDFIKDGKLESFILNYYLSRKTGYPMAKNDTFNVIAAPGEESLDELVSHIQKGILVGGFSGGEPGVNGEFSGVAKNSFLIENGQIGQALTETMISGNLADMLNHFAGASAETECDGSAVLPYMAFEGIVISGK